MLFAVDVSPITRILFHRPNDTSEPLIDGCRRLARRLANEWQLRDPLRDAEDTLGHLIVQLESWHHLFLAADGSVDVPRFKGWSRSVLRNEIQRMKAHQDRELPAQSEQPGGEDGTPALVLEDGGPGWSPGPEQPLIERDKLVLLLNLILELSPSRRDLLLGRAAGFTSDQLAAHLQNKKSQAVIASSLHGPLKQGLAERQDWFTTLYDDPARDVPLFTAATPALARAFAALDRAPGTGLLAAMFELASADRTPFFSRVAGFWDCVIATVLHLSLPAEREAVFCIRERLESRLSRRSGGRSESGPAAGEEEGASMKRQRRVGADRGGAARLAALAEARPEAALVLLLGDPDVLRGLERGRQHLRAAGVLAAQGPMPAQAPSAGDEVSQQTGSRFPVPRPVAGDLETQPIRERLWQCARASLEGASAWLSMPMIPELRLRTPRASPVVEPIAMPEPPMLTFDHVDDARAGQHCLVWVLGARQLRLAYPRVPIDPTQGRHARGQHFVVRPPDPGQTRLIVCWIEERIFPATLLQHQLWEEHLRKWLLERIDRGDLQGLSLHAMELRADQM